MSLRCPQVMAKSQPDVLACVLAPQKVYYKSILMRQKLTAAVLLVGLPQTALLRNIDKVV